MAIKSSLGCKFHDLKCFGLEFLFIFLEFIINESPLIASLRSSRIVIILCNSIVLKKELDTYSISPTHHLLAQYLHYFLKYVDVF